MRHLSLFTAAIIVAASSLRAGTPCYRNTVLADNPVAYWEMDEAAGATLAADSAGTPQAGNYENVTLGQASAFANLGSCGQFNGSTSRVQVAADAAFNLGTGDFTVEAWAKTPVTGRGDIFNYKNSTDFGILLNNSAAGTIETYLNGFLPSYTAAVGAWYHIVLTRGSGMARLYVNGVERGSAAATSSFSANAPVFIGANHTGAPNYTITVPFNGWIDEVAVYGTALSATRVLDHYNAAQTVGPPAPPAVVNLAPTGVTIFWATLRGQITGTGNAPPETTIYWGASDGGTSTAAWTNAASLGTQSGAFSKLVSGLTPSTTYYYRARAVNVAGTAWAPATQAFTTPATSALEVVINEIHCDHEDKTLRVEFIELYNPGTSPLDLAGWYFDKGVDFTFPSGASIPAGGYAVVAENPAALQAAYGYAGAYGSWSGSLQTEGEKITLRNPGGDVADEVDYGLGFPWPTTGVAPNYSLELIHPSLDNSLGGNWRSKASAVSGTDPELVLVAPASTAWRFRRGCFAAPAADWLALAHAEDGFWENGTTAFNAGTGFYQGIGYGDSDDATSLAAPFPPTPAGIIAMQNGYRSVYLRQTFNVPAAEIRGNLKLRIYVDDGCVVWLNGAEVPQRFFVSAGTVGHNGAGVAVTNHEAAPNTWTELTIPTMSSWIQPGQNIIAIHALNDALTSSDFSINAELRRVPGAVGGSPTPGAVNSVFTTNVPPAIRQVEHAPATPVPGQTAILPGQAVSVSAKVTDPQGVQSVSLLYQIVEPGAYIKKEDAAYELSAYWTPLPMLDDGGGTDLIAGDGTFTAVIPASVQTHRRLVRYRIQAADVPGNSVRVPYADDPAPNFAYFVYGPMPDYVGAINPGGLTSYTSAVIPSHTATSVTYPASMLQQLPTYHLLTTRQNHVDAQYLPGAPGATNPTVQFRGDESLTATDEQAYPWRGTIVYDGKVYDHIRFRARGGVWRYSMGKNMWKFDMMRGHDFQTRDNYGKQRDEKWKKLNFSACIQQGDFNNRGEHGLSEAVGFRLFQLSGMPANHTNFVHFRVIEQSSEAGPTSSQYDDDFQGLYLAIEQEDGQFLKEHGLPDGNLYKMEGGTGELNNQGATQPANKSDLNAFLTYPTTEAWWRANAVLPNYYNYRAIIDCIHHYDIGDGKNYFYYHYPVEALDPNSNKWQPAVWDLDLTWADNMYRSDSGIEGLAPSGNTTEPYFSRVWPLLPLRTELRNRDREVLDLLFNQEQTGMIIDELASFIYQPGVPSFSGADRAQWDYNPLMISSFINTSKAGHGRFYQSAVDDPATIGVNEALTFPGQLQLMRNYITTRRNVITAQILGDEAQVPVKPVVTRAGGAAAFPTNDLTFTASAYSSPSAKPFAKMKWRIAEITNPNAAGYNRWAHTEPRLYEADPKNTWESPEIAVFNNTFTFPAAAAHVGRTYRVRVKFADAGDAAGGSVPRWSHWSAPVTFTTTAPDISAYLNSLVVSEVMYNPRDPSGLELNASTDNDDFEYVVVMNAGATTLDMTNIRFTKGIDFDFAGSAVASLAPGQRAVVVKNPAAFNARYGARPGSISIAGQWSANDNLSNSGEQIKLSFGAGVTLRDFTYDDEAPWPVDADGAGYSLVLIAPWAIPNHTLPQNWRLSTKTDGGAGQYDGQRFTDWKTANAIAGDLDDTDNDGLSALMEFTLLGNPAAASQSLLPTASVGTFGTEEFLTLTVRTNRAADDALLLPERTSDLSVWDGSPAGIALVSAVPDANGGTTWHWRSAAPLRPGASEFLRLRVQLR